MFTYLRLSIDIHWIGVNLIQLGFELDTVIPMSVGFVCINLQPEYVPPSSTRFGQFQIFGKIGVGSTFLPATPKETISALGLSSCS